MSLSARDSCCLFEAKEDIEDTPGGDVNSDENLLNKLAHRLHLTDG